jgi:multicomponent Na+:H+ antiporter subunit D
LSIIGLPPTAGFFSKYYLALAAIESGQVAFLLALVISSLLSAVYFFRVIERAYLMQRTETVETPELPELPELPRTMLTPVIALAVLVLLLGVFNHAIVVEVILPGLPS